MWCLGPCRPAADRTSGSAVVLVLVGILLLSAVGLATVLLATADAQAAANQRDAAAVLYAAEAGLELAASELAGVSDWDGVLSGNATSVFADGLPSGLRTLPGGGSIRLEAVASLATCGASAGCSVAARQAVTDDRPWGANAPPGTATRDMAASTLRRDSPGPKDSARSISAPAPGFAGASPSLSGLPSFSAGSSPTRTTM
jgi:hypothetical protein